MRGDLCSHAEGTLIPELQRQGLRIPLQPVPVIDDNGYICVDPPVDIRRELLDHKEKFAVIEHDIQVLTAKIEYLAICKGVTSDELDAGARQHLGAVVDTLVPTATPRKHAKAEPTADGSGQKEVAQTPPTRALAAVPSISPCPAPHTSAVKDSQVTAGDATPAVVRQQQRDHLAVALRSRAKTPVPAAPGNLGRVASSGRTGVMWNAAKQRYYVRIISARRQQVRLGSYEDKDEASYAYAAGAVVLRPNSRISCTVELSDGDRQALAGCTEEILRLLVKYRRWNRWREWRAAMAGLDDAQPVETRSRRKGRVSRAISDVEEVEATTQTTEDQPMAEEPEDPPEDYTDDDESVDDDAVIVRVAKSVRQLVRYAVCARKLNTLLPTTHLVTETREVPLQICSAKAVGAVDAEAACTPIVASAPQGEEDTEAVKERLIDELMEGEDEDDEEGNAGGQSSSNDPCGENGSEEEQATKAPHSRKRIEAADGQVTREEFDALRDSQNDTAKTLARLESHVLTIIRLDKGHKRKRASTSAAASLGREASKRKCQSDDDEESTCDEDELPAKVARHARHDKSPVLQTALDILPAEKAWKRERRNDLRAQRSAAGAHGGAHGAAVAQQRGAAARIEWNLRHLQRCIELLLSEEQHGFVEIMNDILDLSNIEANEFEMGTATSLSPSASRTALTCVRCVGMVHVGGMARHMGHGEARPVEACLGNAKSMPAAGSGIQCVFTPAQFLFSFFLPLAPLSSPTLLPLSHRSVCDGMGAARTTMNKRVASTMLARIVYECTVAANSLDAIRCRQTHPFDLPLMDVQVSGALRKKCTTRLKALLLSALHSLVSNTCETPTSTYRINTLPHLQHLGKAGVVGGAAMGGWVSSRGGIDGGDEGAVGAGLQQQHEQQLHRRWVADGSSAGLHGGRHTPVGAVPNGAVIDCNNSSSNCVDGGWPTAALDYIVDATRQWGGLAAETPFFPYLQRQSRCVRRKATTIGITGYDQVDFYGWFGLLLAVNMQPTIAFVRGSYPSFQTYTQGIYSDAGCAAAGVVDHSVLVMGYSITAEGAFWILRNSWGASWGMQVGCVVSHVLQVGCVACSAGGLCRMFCRWAVSHVLQVGCVACSAGGLCRMFCRRAVSHVLQKKAHTDFPLLFPRFFPPFPRFSPTSPHLPSSSRPSLPITTHDLTLDLSSLPLPPNPSNFPCASSPLPRPLPLSLPPPLVPSPPPTRPLPLSLFPLALSHVPSPHSPPPTSPLPTRPFPLAPCQLTCAACRMTIPVRSARASTTMRAASFVSVRRDLTRGTGPMALTHASQVTSNPSYTVVFPIDIDCPLVYQLYGLTEEAFLAQNPDLSMDHCVTIPKNTEVSVLPPLMGSVQCGLFYSWTANDTCKGVASLFSLTVAGLLRLNPGINCTSKTAWNAPTVNQQLCVALGNGADLPMCTAWYTVKAGDTCAGIMADHSLNDTTFFALNPGLGCDSLFPSVGGSLFPSFSGSGRGWSGDGVQVSGGVR
ncbi:unnamed protein product [Closterium sp. Naga37s-1]|nr:unnamed protein product [Closterium sp. Naga37s-1]